jgi:hypothetical protein
MVDQIEPAGACVAEKFGIPFVTLSNALVANEEPGIPPLFTTWPSSASFAAKVRNRIAYRLVARLTRPWLDSINGRRRKLNGSYRSIARSGTQPRPQPTSVNNRPASIFRACICFLSFTTQALGMIAESAPMCPSPTKN